MNRVLIGSTSIRVGSAAGVRDGSQKDGSTARSVKPAERAADAPAVVGMAEAAAAAEEVVPAATRALSVTFNLAPVVAFVSRDW